MDFYNLFSTNFELLLPEIFLITSIIGLILYGSIVISSNYILTYYTNKISLCIVGIMLILTCNTYFFNYNYEFFNYNFIILIKSIIILSVFCCIIFSENSTFQYFEFSFLILLSLIGFLLITLSFDLILLYIAIEIQSISFYILSCLKKNSAFSTEAGLKYFILGALASGFFLFGCSLIYGITGTINFNELTNIFISFNDQPLIIIASLFILVSIFFKLSVAPFHIWTPDVYEGSPTIVTAFFSITPKLGIFIILNKFFNEIFYDLSNLISWWIFFGVICSFISIYIGSITALKQTRLKRLLAYSSIGHVGYMLVGFFSGNIEGIQAVFFYLILYIITNICIWGSILSINKIKFISELKNVYIINPFLCCTLILSFFSLAGIPPLVGFLSKLSIFIAAFESNLYVIIILSIILSIISTFYYLRMVKILIFEKTLNYNFIKNKNYFSKLISYIISFTFISLFLLFIFPLPLSLFTYYLSLYCF